MPVSISSVSLTASQSNIDGTKDKKSTHSIEAKDSRRQLSGKLSGKLSEKFSGTPRALNNSGFRHFSGAFWTLFVSSCLIIQFCFLAGGLAPSRRPSASSSFENALGCSPSEYAAPGSAEWVYVDEPLPKVPTQPRVPNQCSCLSQHIMDIQ